MVVELPRARQSQATMVTNTGTGINVPGAYQYMNARTQIDLSAGADLKKIRLQVRAFGQFQRLNPTDAVTEQYAVPGRRVRQLQNRAVRSRCRYAARSDPLRPGPRRMERRGSMGPHPPGVCGLFVSGPSWCSTRGLEHGGSYFHSQVMSVR